MNTPTCTISMKTKYSYINGIADHHFHTSGNDNSDEMIDLNKENNKEYRINEHQNRNNRENRPRSKIVILSTQGGQSQRSRVSLVSSSGDEDITFSPLLGHSRDCNTESEYKQSEKILVQSSSPFFRGIPNLSIVKHESNGSPSSSPTLRLSTIQRHSKVTNEDIPITRTFNQKNNLMIQSDSDNDSKNRRIMIKEMNHAQIYIPNEKKQFPCPSDEEIPSGPDEWNEQKGNIRRSKRILKRSKRQNSIINMRNRSIDYNDGSLYKSSWIKAFEDISGLDHHIQRLQEMVLWPLLYPNVFKTWNIRLPRGVLFHGPPGTGKTMLAKALVQSCPHKISFYMRSGAEILSKWIGEAEKNLRKLFQKARRTSPSIIFFDEIDGIAPARNAKQDQSHISLVSTLLTLMDGIYTKNNTDDNDIEETPRVIVIGATNRLNALDPALRRPGRFDHEFYFPLPNESVRLVMLQKQIRKWSEKDNERLISEEFDDAFLSWLACQTIGYCGADIQALCTEAALSAMRRSMTLNNDTSSFTNISISKQDFLHGLKVVMPSSKRNNSSNMIILGDYKNSDQYIARLIEPTVKKLEKWWIDRETSNPMSLLLYGDCRLHMRIVQGFFSKLDSNVHIISLSLTQLYGDHDGGHVSCESQLLKYLKEAMLTDSILYIPNIDVWYKALSRQTQCWSVFTTFIEEVSDSMIGVFATMSYDHIDDQECDSNILLSLPQSIQSFFKISIHASEAVNAIQVIQPTVAEKSNIIQDASIPSSILQWLSNVATHGFTCSQFHSFITSNTFKDHCPSINDDMGSIITKKNIILNWINRSLLPRLYQEKQEHLATSSTLF